MLLARACNTQSSSSWLALYCQLMKGCEGENIQARRGLELIHELANSLKDHEKPMHVRGNQLFVDNSAIFKQVTLTQVLSGVSHLLAQRTTDNMLNCRRSTGTGAWISSWTPCDPSLMLAEASSEPLLAVRTTECMVGAEHLPYTDAVNLCRRVEFDASGQLAVITVVSQGILEKIGDAYMSGLRRPLQHNLVQLLKWPSAADDPAADFSGTGTVFARTDPNIRQLYMARSLQLARFFSPHPPAVISAVSVSTTVPAKVIVGHF